MQVDLDIFCRELGIPGLKGQIKVSCFLIEMNEFGVVTADFGVAPSRRYFRGVGNGIRNNKFLYFL